MEIRSAGTPDTECARGHRCRAAQTTMSVFWGEIWKLNLTLKCSYLYSKASYPGRGMHFLSSHCRPGRWAPACRLAWTPCRSVSGRRWRASRRDCARYPPGHEGRTPHPAARARCRWDFDRGLRDPPMSSSPGFGKVVRWSEAEKITPLLRRWQHRPPLASAASDLCHQSMRWRRPPASCRCRSNWPAGRTQSCGGCSASQW